MKLLTSMDLRFCTVYFFAALLTQGDALGSAANEDELRLSVPLQHYWCPEGANVTLVCEEHGHPHTPRDEHLAWLFTPHMDHHCPRGQHPRGGRTTHTNTNHSLPLSALAQPGKNGSKVLLTLLHVRREDQGRYCCLLAEKHHKISHNHVLLTVGPPREGGLTCTELNSSEGTLSATAATAACIMAFLCLPFILVLVYKQRQTAQASRRAHELVRMDSEAQGHDNPVFLGGSPQVKTRTVSQILTRQSSETGRHLLSDPGTPLSPGYGEVFFPTQEPIPESPNILQV